jgi:hypothetical protein
MRARTRGTTPASFRAAKLFLQRQMGTVAIMSVALRQMATVCMMDRDMPSTCSTLVDEDSMTDETPDRDSDSQESCETTFAIAVCTCATATEEDSPSTVPHGSGDVSEYPGPRFSHGTSCFEPSLIKICVRRALTATLVSLENENVPEIPSLESQ